MPKVMDQHCDVSAFCDEECTRYALSYVKWDAEAGAFVASDSRMLAIAAADEVDKTEKPLPDRDIFLPGKVVSQAAEDCQRRSPRQDDKVIDIAVEADQVLVTTTLMEESTRRCSKALGGKFVPWRDVLPAGDHRVIYLNPKLLKRLADFACDHGYEGAEIALLIDAESDTKAIEAVVPVGRYGGKGNVHIVIMPCTPDDDDERPQRASDKWPAPEKDE